MIERLVTLCFNRRGIVVLVFLFAALYGWHSWTQLPLEAYPDIADTTSQVVTQVNGLAAEEVIDARDRIRGIDDAIVVRVRRIREKCCRSPKERCCPRTRLAARRAVARGG